MSVAWQQTVTAWGGTGTSETSGSFTPGTGNAIIVYGGDFSASSSTLSFSGTGTYNVLSPPGQFSDTDADTHALAWNSSSTASSQTIATSTGASHLTNSWAFEYSGVKTASGAAVQRNSPGTGTGAILGTSTTVSSGDVLLAICVCINGNGTNPSISSPSGTNRSSGNNNNVNYCVTEYAGAGASIQPSFTATAGTDFAVLQFLLSASGGVVPYPPMALGGMNVQVCQ